MNDNDWFINKINELDDGKMDENFQKSLIDHLKKQQDEINSLRVAMEGNLWSPKGWSNDNKRK